MGKLPYHTQVGVSQLQPLQDLEGKMGKRVVEKIWQDACVAAVQRLVDCQNKGGRGNMTGRVGG